MKDDFARKFRTQLFFWIAFFIVFLLFLWLFSDILLPFVAGMALAYFLDPVADWLERLGTSRLVATVIIMVCFVVIFVLFLMILIPILGSQISGFLARLPHLVTELQGLVASSESTWLRDLIGIEGKTLQDNLGELMKQGASWLSALLQQVWNSGKALINVISLLIVTPVVAFYLLYDWDNMTNRIDDLLPRDHRETIRGILKDIDGVVAGFVRGQGTLCLILGLFYGIALTIIGLNFGLLIGLFAGLISFIPFVGSITGLILSVGVALVQFWPDYGMIIAVVLVYGVGQFMEGNVLQPKLVGESIGLHPVWLMFSLFAFGSLFGFTGMLIAVPAAAAVGVIIRFFLGRYLQSEFYRGHNGQ